MLAHEIPNSQEFNQPVARNWVVNFYQDFLKVVSFSYQNNRGKMVLPIWTIKMCRGKRWECCVPKFFPPFDASIDGLRQFWRWAKKHVNKKQPQLLKPNQSCNTNPPTETRNPITNPWWFFGHRKVGKRLTAVSFFYVSMDVYPEQEAYSKVDSNWVESLTLSILSWTSVSFLW